MKAAEELTSEFVEQHILPKLFRDEEGDSVQFFDELAGITQMYLETDTIPRESFSQGALEAFRYHVHLPIVCKARSLDEMRTMFEALLVAITSSQLSYLTCIASRGSLAVKYS